MLTVDMSGLSQDPIRVFWSTFAEEQRGPARMPASLGTLGFLSFLGKLKLLVQQPDSVVVHGKLIMECFQTRVSKKAVAMVTDCARVDCPFLTAPNAGPCYGGWRRKGASFDRLT